MNKTLTYRNKAVNEISFQSRADNKPQPALFYKPNTNAPAPLLVALHTWSANYTLEPVAPYDHWCVEKNWVFIYPDFRGPNVRPQATGSELVIGDILSAVEYAQEQPAAHIRSP